MRTAPVEDSERLQWVSPLEAPFQLTGLGWKAENAEIVNAAYYRFPVLAQVFVREPVYELAKCPTGAQVRFLTDSAELAVRVRLAGQSGMYHMPATAQSGIDCYIGLPGELRYCSTARFEPADVTYESLIFKHNHGGGMRMITLNLPLYQSLEELWIGLEAGAKVAAPPAYAGQGPVIVYGTSITQGGCANRPGMAYTNILSRKIDREFINLGFSGNGLGEPEVARLIAEIDNPALLVVDFEANCADRYEQALPEFITTFRESRPDTPMLVVSKIPYSRELFDPEQEGRRLELLTFQRGWVAERRRTDPNLHFFDGSSLLGEDFEECTVDGVHPTDLGFYRMAEGLRPVIEGLLAQGAP